MIPGHFYWDLKGIDKPEELFDQYDDNNFMIDEQYGITHQHSSLPATLVTGTKTIQALSWVLEIPLRCTIWGQPISPCSV